MPSKKPAGEEEIEVDEAPTSIDPYATLGLDQKATQDQIKVAYRKAALKHHPDKAAPEDRSEAHTKFQEIAFAYAILSDERRRRRYDTTGRTEESLDLEDDDFDWTTFFREQFANVVTTEAIDAFSQTYKGSEEERGHVLAAYTRHEGNMDRIYATVMLSDVLTDDERFRATIEAAIAAGEVDAHPRYTDETKKQRANRVKQALKKQKDEAIAAEKATHELAAEGKVEEAGLGDLAALIQKRQKARAESFFDRLEDKYAPTGNKGTKKRPAVEEPPEEAFANNRKMGKVDDDQDGPAREGSGTSRKSKKRSKK